MKRNKIALGYRHILLCLIFYFFTWITPTRGQEILSLQTAIAKGLAANKNIMSGTLESEILKLKTNEVQGAFRPTLSVEYNYRYNPILPTSILPIGVFNPNFPPDATQSVRFGTSWSQTAGVNINQPLLNISLKRKLDEARLTEKISRARVVEREYELVHAIVLSYINIFILESERREALADSSRTFESYRLQEIRFNENRLLKADLNKAKINHNQAKQKVLDATAKLMEEKIFLLYLTGEKDLEETDFLLDTSFFNPGTLAWTDKVTIVEKLPSFQRLTLQENLVDCQSLIQKAAFLPTIHMQGYLGANQFSNTFNPFAANSWFGISYVGIHASVPIVSEVSLPNRLQQIQLQGQQYNLEKEQLSEEVHKNVTTVRLKIQNLTSRIQTLEENLALTRETLVIYQQRFSAGQESTSTLNMEEKSYQLLQTEYESEKRGLWMSWIDFMKTSGLLWEMMPIHKSSY